MMGPLRWFQEIVGSACRRKPVQRRVSSAPLDRCLGAVDLTMIGVGSMIGSGVFLLPGQLVGVVAGPISLLAFFISGLIALLAGLCCTECALQIPETGAAYAFAYATLGEMVAFLIGWGGVATRILGVALIAQVWSGYLDEATGGYIQNATIEFVLGGEEWDAPLLSSYPDFVAGLVILASNALVSFGTNVFSKVNNVFVLSTLLTLTFVFIVAMIHANFFYLVEHGFAPRGVGLDEVVASVFTAYLGYAGFETIALCAEEAKDQTKDLLMGLLAAVAISMLVYLAGSLSITVLAEYSNIDLKSPFEAVFDELDGLHWMKYIVAISALCSVTGGALNFAYSSTRFIYPMSRDGLLPAMLSKTSETTKTPLLANFLGACLSLVLGVLIDIKFLIQVPSMLFTLETVGVIFAAVILRYNPTIQSEYMEVESKDESCGTGGSSVPHVNRHHSNLEMKGLLDQMQETFTGDNNAGSDPPSPPSLIKKASTVLFQWIRNHPTRSVILSLCLHITFEFLFVGLLTFTLEDFSQASDSSLVLWIVICGVLCLIACFPLLLLPQYRDELPFKVILRRVNKNGIYAAKPYACHQCDKCFGRKFNIERHMENIHVEEESDTNEVDENSDSVEEVDDETSDEDSSDLEDNAAYQDWLAEARETHRGMWDGKYDKYLNEGMDEDQARQKASRKTLCAVKTFLTTIRSACPVPCQVQRQQCVETNGSKKNEYM